MDLVISEPRRCRRADLGLPDVALGLLLQADVRPQQWVHRHGAPALGRAAVGAGSQIN